MKNFLLLIFCFAAIQSAAQEPVENPAIKWGPILKGGGYDLVALSNDGKRIILSDASGLSLYNDSLTLISTREVKYYAHYQDVKLNHLGDNVLGDKIVEFYYHFHLKGLSADFYYQLLDRNTLKPLTDFVMFHTNEVIAPVNLGFTDLGFTIGKSPDESTLCTIFKSKQVKTGKIDYHAIVFDVNMKMIWEKQFAMKAEDKTMIITSSQLDSVGDLYMQAVVYPEDKQQKEKYVFALTDQGEHQYHFEIPPQGKFFNVIMSDPLDGIVICSGLYSDNGAEEMKGFYCMRVDLKTKKILQSIRKDFTASFVGSFPKDMKNKEEDALRHFDLDKICYGENQSLYMVASNSNSRMHYANSNSMYYASTNAGYGSGSFVVIKLAADFGMSWIINIPRFYASASDDFGEYNIHHSFITVQDEKLYLLFNDSQWNMDVQAGDPLNEKSFHSNQMKKVVATLIDIGPDGKWSKQILFPSSKEEGRRLYPKNSAVLKEGAILLYLSNPEKLKWELAKFPLK